MSGLDCGDNSCRYATERGGMRTNGGCRCDECPFCGRHLGGIRKAGHTEWCQWRVRLAHIAKLSGLRVVTEKDAAVLEACAALSKNDVHAYAETVTPMFLVARAERARRGTAP